METVIFFASATRHSCRNRVAGVQRYFASSDIQVVVVESNYSHINIKKVLDFWHPVGCIAECGSDIDEFRPEIFGDIPTVYLDRDPALSQKINGLYETVAEGIEGVELTVLGALFQCFGALSQGREKAALDVAAPQFSQKAQQLKPALEYIETHYGQPITLDALARLSGLSPKYFCRFFRAIVHRSPIDYVNYYRIECASHFLSTTDMTVAEIAQHCGYNDSSFFIKQFKKYKGTTPKQYRQ